MTTLNSSAPEYIQRMDWALLRWQKAHLASVAEKPYSSQISEPEREACHGLLHLIDAIQDAHEAQAGQIQKPGFSIPGWEVEQTGGNCTALMRRCAVDASQYWLITDDASAPDALDQPCTLGLYFDDGGDMGTVIYPTVSAALVAVAASEGRAVDPIERAITVIEESDEGEGRDAHKELIAELRGLIGEVPRG